MRTIRLMLAFMTPLCLGAVGCATDTEATIQNAQGEIIGTARVSNSRELLVRVTVEITRGTPGQHGVHLHETGQCQGPDFASAGGHFNPSGLPHGDPDFPAHHAGDLGNIVIDQDGRGRIDLTTNVLTATPAAFNSALGRSIIYHANQDDLATDPTGNSGPRTGCGVFE